MGQASTSQPASWVARLNRWGRWHAAGTSGRPSVSNGTSRLLRGYGVVVAVVGLVNLFNVLNVMHEVARAGRTLAVWQPIMWEGSSFVATLAACWTVVAALRAAPPTAPIGARFLSRHAAASVVYSAQHIAGMVALRYAVCAAIGHPYHFPLGDVPYEYRKDFLAYVILAAIFWACIHPPAIAATTTAHDPFFDITESGRLLRVRPNDILALRAAGNYVEFALADGRKKLMRTTLRDLEATFDGFGFVRTHRSWIVNPRRMAQLRPTGSGDFVIALDQGGEIPVSRRFPDAVRRLRQVG